MKYEITDIILTSTFDDVLAEITSDGEARGWMVK